jgi:Fic family protein
MVMDTKAFSSPSGELVTNGKIVAFVPNFLPPTLTYDDELIQLMAEAHSKLGVLSGMGINLPNPSLLISPYLRREAILSSKIEGTQASLADLLLYEAKPRRTDESGSKSVREVSNHVQALQICLSRVRKKKPIDIKMIRDAHRYLLQDVRGQERGPGSFRTEQNWIGPDSRIEHSRYVPPPMKALPSLLMNFEGFVQHPPDGMSKLVQCAIMHYQFEAIHPFVDGNGRLGRLLVVLFLCDKGVLTQPLLYLSAYLDKHKEDYNEKMLRVSQKGEWNQWIAFFMRALATQADEAIRNVQELLALKARYEKRLEKYGASSKAMTIATELFSRPYLTNRIVRTRLAVTAQTAQNVINQLVDLGILRQVTQGKRDRIYGAKEILEILS